MTEKKLAAMATAADLQRINQFITNNPYCQGDSDECELLKKVFATIKDEAIDAQLAIYTYFMNDKSPNKAATQLGISPQYVCSYVREWLKNVRKKLNMDWLLYLNRDEEEEEHTYTMRNAYDDEE